MRRRKTNRRAFLQRIASGGDKEASASIVVDGYYAGVGDYSPFVISIPIQFGGGLRSTIETFSAQYPTKCVVDLQSSALSVMNEQLVGDAAGYSDYVVQAALNAIGDKAQAQKFEEGSKLIKRDIVFAASLYL